MKLFKIDDRLSTLLILLVVALFLSATQLFNRIDNQAFDLGQRWFPQAATNQIIIIGIDEYSLKQLGRWPWSRKTHAGLLTQLSHEKTKVIGLDVIFAEPENPLADNALADAIKLAGNVVLPQLLEVSHQSVQVTETLPLAMFAKNAAGVGRVHVQLDEDGIARSVYLQEGINQNSTPLFAEQILQVAGILPLNFIANKQNTQTKSAYSKAVNDVNNSKYSLITQAPEQNGLIRSDVKKINFLGPPNTVPAVSYAKVLAGDYPKNYFKNKIVLVGATASGMGDFLPTPMSALQQPMSGIEFHANVITAIYRDHLVSTPPKWLIIMVCGLLAILPMLWIPSMSPFNSLMTNVGYFFFVAGLGILLPQLAYIWLPVSSALVSIVLAYPVWSWRKLEAAQRYLDAELVSLRNSLSDAGLIQEDDQPDGMADRFQSRISQVRAASSKLQEFRSDRYEILAFISHDIRAPLATAQMILKEETSNPKFQRVINMLGRALTLSESYLCASRAEMLTTQQFELVDLVAVCHQAFDDAYDIANAKKIKLLRNLPDEVIWLSGDFNLLHRAILNLLLNAIKYSNENTEVSLNFTLEKAYATIAVKDQGFGIPYEQMQKLFKRYSRLPGGSNKIEGTGLGLYFVKTVTEKHAGSVYVKSQLGVGSTFAMRLPVID